MKLKFDTVEQHILTKDKIKKDLGKYGFFLFESEGISENEKGQFSIFERFILNTNTNIDIDKIGNYIHSLLGKKIDYFSFLKENKKFNVFFIVFKYDCSFFGIWTLEYRNIKFKNSFNNCKDFSKWLAQHVVKREKIKPFRKQHYLKCIDNCLRDNRVPYPGNFDGILFYSYNLEPKLVLEFSKVNYTTLKRHKENLQGYLGDRYFKEDINRWSIFLNLSKKLKVPNRIIWWYTKSEEYMVGYVEHLKSKEGIRLLTDTIDYKSLIEEIQRVI